MKIFITRQIPDKGTNLLKEKGYELTVSPYDRMLTKEELIEYLKKDRYDAVLCLLTDKIDADVFDAAKESGVKIIANYAVGFDNIDLAAAKKRGVLVTNTPGVLTDAVAEHTFALILAIAHRVSEADRFTRGGKFKGWEPMLLLGEGMEKKTLGVLGLGRIGARVAYYAKNGFDMRVLYYDVRRNEEFERKYGAEFRENPDDIFKEADVVSVHVPLLPSTKHMVNAERLGMMKKTAYIVNTSRGPVIDEEALGEALKAGVIKGAALDVFEHEPEINPLLLESENVILTPHIASATKEARDEMATLAAKNIIAALSGGTPSNLVE